MNYNARRERPRPSTGRRSSSKRFKNGLLALRTTVVATVDTACRVERVDKLRRWTNQIQRLMVRLIDQIAAVESGIAAERKYLMRQRETAFLEAAETPLCP